MSTSANTRIFLPTTKPSKRQNSQLKTVQPASEPSFARQAALHAKTKARLEFLEEDPLEFWDFGMVFAFDLIARWLSDLVGDNQMVTTASVFRLLQEERKKVLGGELHHFLPAVETAPDLPRLAWAARMAAARSVGRPQRSSNKRRQRPMVQRRARAAAS